MTTIRSGYLPRFTADMVKLQNNKLDFQVISSGLTRKILFNKKEPKVKGIKLLRTITDKEALLFAKHNNIKFTPNKKNKRIKEILDKLERLYPQTRFSLSKSVKALK